MPGLAHFDALKHLVGYLRLHPDVPLTFDRSDIAKQVSSINFDLLDPHLHAQANSILLNFVPSSTGVPFDSDPMAYTVMSADPDPTPFPSALPDSTLEVHSVARIPAPFTEAHVDANLPSGLYERIATSGGSIEMGGTTVIAVCKKQDVMAANTTESEIDAALSLIHI